MISLSRLVWIFVCLFFVQITLNKSSQFSKATLNNKRNLTETTKLRVARPAETRDLVYGKVNLKVGQKVRRTLHQKRVANWTTLIIDWTNKPSHNRLTLKTMSIATNRLFSDSPFTGLRRPVYVVYYKCISERLTTKCFRDSSVKSRASAFARLDAIQTPDTEIQTEPKPST